MKNERLHRRHHVVPARYVIRRRDGAGGGFVKYPHLLRGIIALVLSQRPKWLWD